MWHLIVNCSSKLMCHQLKIYKHLSQLLENANLNTMQHRYRFPYGNLINTLKLFFDKTTFLQLKTKYFIWYSWILNENNYIFIHWLRYPWAGHELFCLFIDWSYYWFLYKNEKKKVKPWIVPLFFKYNLAIFLSLKIRLIKGNKWQTITKYNEI